MNHNTSALLVLGNQLFPHSYLPPIKGLRVFMAEDSGLCTHYAYHKHKLILFLSAMRHYANSLKEAGARVSYHELTADSYGLTYEERLLNFIQEHAISRLYCFEIEDKFFEERINTFGQKHDIEIHSLQSPFFLISREEFSNYLSSHEKPFMKTFYEELRRSKNILMDLEGKPLGGSYSFDKENRKKLPKGYLVPSLPKRNPSSIVEEVSTLVDTLFTHHPGTTDTFWLPTTRQESLDWLHNFLSERLYDFGPYEDAVSAQHPFLFHSVLSPLLNLGLITPSEVISETLTFAESHKVPINSLEGFVRQVIGWREFVRGIYQHFSEEQEQANFWNHSRTLASCWYDASTGIPPLDDALSKTMTYGYNHHIERLMIISNLMLLCEIHPQEVHRWFMEMYVDSSDWVMGPNVYGMAQFSDGGIFATKPYICGSNYIRKMSHYPKGSWCDIVDGLYWSFIEKHCDFYEKNPRTAVITGNLKRLDPERKETIYKAAQVFKESVSLPS